MEGRGALREPGHPGSSRTLAKMPDKAAPLELPHSAPAKQLATAVFLQAKKHLKLQASACTAQHSQVPTAAITYQTRSSHLCTHLLCSYRSPLCPATAYSMHPLLHSTRTNAGVVNELRALGPQCCVLHTPRANSDVSKLTWKKHLHSTLAGRAAPGFAQLASSAPESETVLSLDTSVQSRTGFLSCRSKEELNLPLPCPARSQRLLCNC